MGVLPGIGGLAGVAGGLSRIDLVTVVSVNATTIRIPASGWQEGDYAFLIQGMCNDGTVPNPTNPSGFQELSRTPSGLIVRGAISYKKLDASDYGRDLTGPTGFVYSYKDLIIVRPDAEVGRIVISDGGVEGHKSDPTMHTVGWLTGAGVALTLGQVLSDGNVTVSGTLATNGVQLGSGSRMVHYEMQNGTLADRTYDMSDGGSNAIQVLGVAFKAVDAPAASFVQTSAPKAIGAVNTLTVTEDIGTAAEDRVVAVLITLRSDATISSVTIGGVASALTSARHTASSPDIQAIIAIAPVPEGSSAPIVIAASAAMGGNAGYEVLALYGCTALLDVSTGATAGNFTGGTLDFAEGGAVIGVSGLASNSTTTWTGVDQLSNEVIGVVGFSSAAMQTPATVSNQSYSVTGVSAYRATAAVSFA